MRLLISLAMLLPLCSSITPTACAQPPQDGQKKGRPAPKNLKILKPEEVGPAMRSFTVALGVKCDFCHVADMQDRASDDNPKKNVARMMIAMVHDINGKFPEEAGKVYVTCYTCHRGKNQPETAPPPPPPAQ